MKEHTIFESSVLGFFSGIVVSTYLAFLDSTGRYLGSVLDWVALRPLFKAFSSYGGELIASFIFVVVVFTIYGLIAGFLIKKNSKMKFVVIGIIILLIVIIFFQQKFGSANTPVVPEVNYPENSSNLVDRDQKNNINNNVLPQTSATVTSAQQYFGNEVVGDLNGDGKNDVAFIISRDDKDRGMLYYLVTSLATENGHVGTNLVYLGEKIDLQNISIDHGIIGVSYIDRTNNKPKVAYASVKDKDLELIKVVDGVGVFYRGEITDGGKTWLFKPCNGDNALRLVASSSILKSISAVSKGMASTSHASPTILAVLTGKIDDLPAKDVDLVYKQGFWVTNIITLTPDGLCP